MIESEVIFQSCNEAMNEDVVLKTDQICFMCQNARSDDLAFAAVHQYIIENINHVHIDEICRQCSNLFRNECNVEVPPVLIKAHINYHMTDQTVVMQRLLTDLIDVSRKTKKKGFVNNEENTDYHVDTKVVACYLKSVDEICNIYRSFYKPKEPRE